MKKETAEMYSILESTYKNNKLIGMENMVKNQKKIIKKQEEQMKDDKRIIRRMIHVGKVKDQTEFTEDVESHYTEAKKNLRDLKENFRKLDNKLKDKHCTVETMKERTKLIKKIIQEKKRIESANGIKHNATKEDTEEVVKNIEKLEEKRQERLEKLKSILNGHERNLSYISKVIKK